MSVIDALSEGQVRVEEFRDELGKVRHVLDNTDVVLGMADETLQAAEEALEEARRAMPVIIAVAVVTTAAVVGIYLWRRRSSDRERN
jgi:sugar/nucleoside kinase (ribokinase family)|tara:strand:- start:1596 stop:1856 length:261 start_codon:yes stop_codon:yes gene_type:complete